MSRLTDNPALALRAALAPHTAGCFLRWDRRARALLVSDAPRRGVTAPGAWTQSARLRAWTEDGLLHIDLSAADYARLLWLEADVPGDGWRTGWFEAQSLLALLLQPPAREGHADEALLRRAMLACAQDEKAVRAFLPRLQEAHAQALRLGDAASCRACAALCARWLWTARAVGLPRLATVGNND